jgi:hypothetical protein
VSRKEASSTDGTFHNLRSDMIVLADGRPIRARILEVRFLLGELTELSRWLRLEGH